MYDKGFNQTSRFRPHAEIAGYSARIIIFDGQSAPFDLDLTKFGKDSISFGRDTSNDIAINSMLVSGHHGHFKLVNGEWVIVDNPKSLNGLVFNGEHIKNKTLNNGDTVRIDNRAETLAIGVLIIFSTSNKTIWQSITLKNKPEITIGRAKNCDVRLEHVSVSNCHAKIIRKNNAYYLVDNNSTNGIIVNGKKITGKIQLYEKNIIVITNSKLIFTSGRLFYCCFKNDIEVRGLNLFKQVKEKNRAARLPFIKTNKIICNYVSLHIKPGELVAIVGGSGAGKSTIMNCLSGYNKPTSGSVFINGVSLYENLDAWKSVIAYVPQSDIVHDDLSVKDMLMYAARLRLPKDVTNNERLESVNNAIEKLDLTENKETLIKDLSGGQKKRTSIAVELLSNPNLFFLDEPASGLDPSLERSLMLSLKRMTSEGKTVIFVTHSTLCLHMCDKIAFMGKGGNLCFYGSEKEAQKFFEKRDVVDIYDQITDNSVYWKKQYEKDINTNSEVTAASVITSKATNRSCLTLSRILLARNLRILRNDRIRLLIIFASPIFFALLFAIVADGNQFYEFSMTRSILFVLSVTMIFAGTFNSIQEVCKERNIFKREHMAGLCVNSYVISKMTFMFIICFIQTLMIVPAFAWSRVVGLPTYSVFGNAFIEIFITTFLTVFSASAMGIFFSSLVKNPDIALSIAAALMVPQLLLSGIIFELDNFFANIFSFVVIARWSMQGYGSTSNLNALPTIMVHDGLGPVGYSIIYTYSEAYTHSVTHLLFMWGILLVFICVLSWLTIRVLRKKIKKEYRG